MYENTRIWANNFVLFLRRRVDGPNAGSKYQQNGYNANSEEEYLAASLLSINPHRLVCSMEHTSSIIEDSQIALVCSMEHTKAHFRAVLSWPQGTPQGTQAVKRCCHCASGVTGTTCSRG